MSSLYNINLNGLESITYYNVPSVTTGVIQASVNILNAPMLVKYSKSAAASCFLNPGSGQNNTACNTLGNTCVLQLYDSASSSCTLYNQLYEIRQSNRYHQFETSPSLPWPVSLPWLFYEEVAEFVLKRKDLLVGVSLVSVGAGSSKVSELKLVLSAYSMDGNWIGFRNFTSQFQLCGGGQGEIDDWLRVGTNYINGCEISLKSIVDQSSDYIDSNGEPIFYDPYITDSQGKLYPIPVYIRNLREGQPSLQVNADGSLLNDRLVRRFFVTDVATTAGNSNGHYIRYIKALKIVVTLRPDSENLIFPPYIDIEYEDRQLPIEPSIISEATSSFVDNLINSLSASSTAGANIVSSQNISFQTIYTSDLDKFRETWQILLILHLIFGFLILSFRIAAFMRKRRNHAADSFLVIQVVIEAGFSFGVSFFLMCFEIATYWYCFFKLQQDVYTFLPGDNDFKEFEVLLIVGCIGTCVSFAHIVYTQCNQDTFFIDWEKNKMTLTASGAKEYSPVSAWRTIFMCNEYNELQALRITSIELTAIATVFLLEGTALEVTAGIEYLIK